MIKNFYFSIILLVVLVGFLAPSVVALAQTTPNNEYTLLAPLPCVNQTGDPDCSKTTDKTSLEKYLPGLFKLLIGLAAAAAVLRIVFGGFLYMSSDALQGKEDGKTMIWNSVKGLVLVIGAWLILYTVNPGLLELRLNIETVEIAGPPSSVNGGVLAGGGTSRGMTPEEAADSRRIKALLEQDPEKPYVGTYAGPCTKGQTTLCVNLNGLTQTTIDGVLALRKEFGQYINITGGTEGGHAPGGDHPKGNALDFGQGNNPNYQALTSWIVSRGGNPVDTSEGPRYTIQINGRPVTFLKESDPPHWHVTFK